jgi:hypothetical protein
MLDLLVKVTRVGVVIFWFAFALSVAAVIPNPYGAMIIWIAGAVLLIHLAEYFIVKFKIAGLDAGEISFVKTMLFRFTHWVPLLRCPD